MGIAATVAALLRNRAAESVVPEPPVPAGYTVDVSAADAEQPDHPLDTGDGTSIEGIGCIFGMMYADPSGNVTWRRITVRGLFRDGDEIVIRAYCHERKAPRRFESLGIRELVNLKNGDVIDGATAYFERFLSGDPTYQAIRQCGPALQILTFMARCDGHEAPSELDIIVEYVKECCPESGIDETILRAHLANIYPDGETFQSALEALEEMSVEDTMHIVDYAIRVVEADGVTDPRELRWFEDIRKALR